MALTLKIENEISLPDGGPLSITVTGKRGIDIGRDAHLDWTLPDPTRFVSGKHAEVRFRDGAYWLHDVSTNGTFLNGGDHRMQAPHRLRNGDRFTIGHYIIAVALDGEGAEAGADAYGGMPPGMGAPSGGPQELWANPADVAPPIDRSYLRTPKERPAPVNPDFLDWAADVPTPGGIPAPPPNPFQPQNPYPAANAFPPQDAFQAPNPFPPPNPFQVPPGPAPRPAGDMSWAEGPATPGPTPPPPAPPMPAPRRPVWGSDTDEAWAPPEPAAPPVAAAPAPVPPSPVMAPPPPPAVESPEPPSAMAPAPVAAPVAPPPASQPMPPPPAAAAMPGAFPAAAVEQFTAKLAAAAGLPPDTFAGRDPNQIAEQLGVVLRVVAESVMQLLNARLQAKRMARSSSHTMIQALDNNPLKFAPSVDDALKIMFGPPTKSYLDARRAIEQSFADLKGHQIRTYSAMQHALTELMAEIEPQAIEHDTDADRGISALITSRKAKLWDAYVARWQAIARREGDGLIDTFMRLFAEHYDRAGGNEFR